MPSGGVHTIKVETYLKVWDQWAYLYRAVDKHGNTIDLIHINHSRVCLR